MAVCVHSTCRFGILHAGSPQTSIASQSLRDPSEDDDSGSSTEPSDDVYQAIERRLHHRAPGTVSHFIRGRYRSRFIGRTFSGRNARRIAAAHRTFLLAVLSEVAGIFVICLQHLIDLLESL